MDIIIDIQGFFDNYGNFLPKEVALVDLESSIQGHWLIKAPFPYNKLLFSARQKNNWLTTKKHGLKWFDGFITISNLTPIVKFYSEKARCVYVRGDIKLKYLEKLLQKEVINLEEEDIDNTPNKFDDLRTTNTLCTLHGALKIYNPGQNLRCALNNALCLQKWILKERSNSCEF